MGDTSLQKHGLISGWRRTAAPPVRSMLRGNLDALLALQRSCRRRSLTLVVSP